MKDKITSNRATIIVTVLVLGFMILALEAYFFPVTMGLETSASTGRSFDCNSPLFYPDPNDRRGIRPACGTRY